LKRKPSAKSKAIKRRPALKKPRSSDPRSAGQSNQVRHDREWKHSRHSVDWMMA
jgi:hypothetical protein